MRLGLCLTTKPTQGGEHQYTLDLLDAVLALPESNYERVFLVMDPAWPELLAQRGINPASIKSYKGNALAGFLWKSLMLPASLFRAVSPRICGITRMLHALDCDLWLFPSQVRFSYLAPVNSLVAVHDLMHIHERRFPEVSALGKFLRRQYHYREMTRHAAGILVDSELGRRHVVDAYRADPDKVHPLPYVASAIPSSMGDCKQSPIVRRLPKKYLLYPAQLWQHKNHPRLLEALHRLRPQYPDLHLVLVGAPKNGNSAMTANIERFDLQSAVTYLGYVSDTDLAALYRYARALVFPSYFGPTNIPPLEAFTYGCPVACADVYAAREQVGDAALLFNPDSVAEIASAIEKLWADDALCASLVARGTSRAADWGRPQFNLRFAEIIEIVGRTTGRRGGDDRT